MCLACRSVLGPAPPQPAKQAKMGRKASTCGWLLWRWQDDAATAVGQGSQFSRCVSQREGEAAGGKPSANNRALVNGQHRSERTGLPHDFTRPQRWRRRLAGCGGWPLCSCIALGGFDNKAHIQRLLCTSLFPSSPLSRPRPRQAAPSPLLWLPYHSPRTGTCDRCLFNCRC